jgi:hypothetical protein
VNQFPTTKEIAAKNSNTFTICMRVLRRFSSLFGSYQCDVGCDCPLSRRMRTITYPSSVEAAVCFEVGRYVHTAVRTGTGVFLRCQTGSLSLWQLFPAIQNLKVDRSVKLRHAPSFPRRADVTVGLDRGKNDMEENVERWMPRHIVPSTAAQARCKFPICAPYGMYETSLDCGKNWT